MMIFDADNLMDTNMFREVNSQYLDKNKPDFIQCYLGSKNKSGVVAWFYYTSYTITNRFFQEAKYRLGLNCSIGGTGFATSTQYLAQRGGWTPPPEDPLGARPLVRGAAQYGKGVQRPVR